MYQKRYGEAQRGVAQTQASLEDQVASLKLAMDDLAKRLQEKDARVVELEGELAGLSAGAELAAAAPADGADAAVAATGEAELLAMKARALGLMQFYLDVITSYSIHYTKLYEPKGR